MHSSSGHFLLSSGVGGEVLHFLLAFRHLEIRLTTTYPPCNAGTDHRQDSTDQAMIVLVVGEGEGG